MENKHPKGATHVMSFRCAPRVYLRLIDNVWQSYKHKDSCWGKFPGRGIHSCGTIRSLKDIDTIAELREYKLGELARWAEESEKRSELEAENAALRRENLETLGWIAKAMMRGMSCGDELVRSELAKSLEAYVLEQQANILQDLATSVCPVSGFVIPDEVSRETMLIEAERLRNQAKELGWWSLSPKL